MQIACDARPLAHACVQRAVELPRDLADPQLVCDPQQAQIARRRSTPGTSASGSTPARSRSRARAGFVPHAAVVAGDHAEAIRAGTEVGVERLPPRADVLPVAVAAFEFDAELVLLRRDEAQRRVVDLQIANERRKSSPG